MIDALYRSNVQESHRQLNMDFKVQENFCQSALEKSHTNGQDTFPPSSRAKLDQISDEQ